MTDLTPAFRISIYDNDGNRFVLSFGAITVGPVISETGRTMYSSQFNAFASSERELEIPNRPKAFQFFIHASPDKYNCSTPELQAKHGIFFANLFALFAHGSMQGWKYRYERQASGENYATFDLNAILKDQDIDGFLNFFEATTNLRRRQCRLDLLAFALSFSDEHGFDLKSTVTEFIKSGFSRFYYTSDLISGSVLDLIKEGLFTEIPGPLIQIAAPKVDQIRRKVAQDLKHFRGLIRDNAPKPDRVKVINKSVPEAESTSVPPGQTVNSGTITVSPEPLHVTLSSEAPEAHTDQPTSSQTPEDLQLGGYLNISREADSADACLNAMQYADALANLFRTADGDFAFGLLGHWGRGKTFLANLVAQRLEQFGDYQVVRFSAWAYPQTPSLWAHLHNSFVKKIDSQGWWYTFQVRLRLGLVRHGIFAFLFAITLIAISLFPLEFRVHWLRVLWGFLGFAGVLYLLRLSIVTWFQFPRLWRMLAMPHHREHLGLQATIGQDLKQLLVAWVPVVHPSLDERETQGQTQLLDVAWKHSILLVPPVFLLCASLSPLTISNANDNLRGLGWLIVAFTLLIVGVCWFNVYFSRRARAPQPGTRPSRIISSLRRFFSRSSPKRVLLVIDDLDRCESSQMLAIAENLKQFLEASAIGLRLQIMILIDESALAYAISQKYGRLSADATTPVVKPNSWEVIQENFEKLFVAYLRLPALQSSEITEIALRYLEQIRNIAKPESNPQKNEPTTNNDQGKRQESPRTPRMEHQPHNAAVLLESQKREIETPGLYQDKIVFSNSEEKMLLSAIDSRAKEAQRSRMSPRSIRCFFFRFQLAKLLLRQLGIQLTPETSAQLARVLVNTDHCDFGLNLDPAVNAIGQQVSLGSCWLAPVAA